MWSTIRIAFQRNGGHRDYGRLGKPLFQIEHEIRSMTHPLYARPLVNRNPAQTNRTYVAGRDAWVPDAMVEEMDNPRDERSQRRIEAAARRVAAE